MSMASKGFHVVECKRRAEDLRRSTLCSPKWMISISIILLSFMGTLHPKSLTCALLQGSHTTTPMRTNFIDGSYRHSTLRRAVSDERTSTNTSPEEISKVWTLKELEDYSASDSIGVVISLTTLGPGYRAVARAKHDESIILGYVEGFLRPTQPELLHLDKMEIFQPVLDKVRKARPGTLNFGGVNIGLGLMMGYRCLLHATAEEESRGRKPRTVAEFLAIDDQDFQHKRLVRYYRSAGFQIVKYVGEDISCIPDRLVWGGCGTLMKQDIPVLMEKWTSLFELMKTRVEKKKMQASEEKEPEQEIQ